MLTHLICAAWMVTAQAPETPAESAAPAPAATEAQAAGDNAPPALFDPAAEEASQQRDRLIKRVITWSGAAVGGVGLAVAAVGLAVLGGAVASWLYANSLEDAGKKGTGDASFRLLGNVLMGVGGVLAILAAPAAALGSAWFVTAYLNGGI